MDSLLPGPLSGADALRVGRSVEQRIAGAASCLQSATEHRNSVEALSYLQPEPREVLGYLYHQIAEQWFRALLWYLDREIPETHDLLQLLHAAAIGPGPTTALRRYCVELNAYVQQEARLLPEKLSKADLAAARHAAERIVLGLHDAFVFAEP